MQKLLFEYLDLRQLPATRAAFALRNMDSRLAASGILAPDLQARLTEAQAEARRTIRTDQRWLDVRANKSRKRGDATVLNRDIDETVKAIHKRLEADAIGKENDPAVIAANTILKAVFSQGYSPITLAAFDVQLGLVDNLLDSLEDDLDVHVLTLGLERHVQNLRDLNEQFRIELDAENGRPFGFPQVNAQRNALREAIAHVIIAIFHDLRLPTPENTALLNVIFEPLKTQTKAVSDAYRAKRRVRDIDPKSGEELDTDSGSEDVTDTDNKDITDTV